MAIHTLMLGNLISVTDEHTATRTDALPNPLATKNKSLARRNKPNGKPAPIWRIRTSALRGLLRAVRGSPVRSAVKPSGELFATASSSTTVRPPDWQCGCQQGVHD